MTARSGSATARRKQETVKGQQMAYANGNDPVARSSEEKVGFLRRLWLSIVQFDDALNFDRHDDLARRISELERKSKA